MIAGRGPAEPSASLPDEVSGAARILAAAPSAVLLAHVNPDADALGSALALGLALSRRGSRIAVSFAEPQEVPESLAGLPGAHLITRPERLPDRPGLVVTLDVAAAERLGALAALLFAADQVLVVDHHGTNTRFGDHHLVDPLAEATCVLVARLLDDMRVTIDPEIAACLYAGLATDTLSFRNATAATHQLAARLVHAGARPAELLRPITDEHPFGYLPMLAAVLGRAERITGAAGDEALVHASVTLRDAAGLRSEEVDSVIDIIRTTAGAGVTAVAKQVDAASWQVSLRSGGALDVAAVARTLGGGGHWWAAGFHHRGDYRSAIRRLRDALATSVAQAPGRGSAVGSALPVGDG